jgi:hypothetical protein
MVSGVVLQHFGGCLWEATRVHVVKLCIVGPACFVGLVDSVARLATSLAESDTSAARLVTSVAGLATSLVESNKSVAKSVPSPSRSTASVKAVRVPCWWRLVRFQAGSLCALQQCLQEALPRIE